MLLFHPLSLVPLLPFLYFIYKWILTPQKSLPPSPPKLPIIGNLHQLGTLPFRSLKTLSEKHGDLMLIHLGSKPAIVVSSVEVASKVFKTHDVAFSNRPPLSSRRRIIHNGKDMVSAPYGEYWRQMRSICVLQLLSKKRVQSYRKVREEEVAQMIKNIEGRELVNLSDTFFSITNDVICRVAFGKKYRGCGGDIDFGKLLEETMKLIGRFHIGDYISWLSWIDKVTGVDAMVSNVSATFDRVLERILQDHSTRATEKDVDGGENAQMVKDFLDILLQAQGDDECENSLLDRDSIKGLIQDIFAAGTETTATTLEWIMSELLRHPRVMQELHKEISRIVGDKEIVTEDELEKMNYLKAVVKEALRLHPVAPLLPRHLSTEDIRMNGYDIFAGTQVLINIWAISRNPKYWEEPESFYPERFLNSPIDYKGHDLQFIPFGSGRRICPGMALSMVSIELVIANIVHRFDWSLPDGATGESLDMTEKPGITVRRKAPLVVVPSPRIY